ncbi:sensor histidine kinase [Sphingomonas lutea]|uniref:histidine kinase n=1 Tax=Sphingomonas lutea TaxID=1045317 RepID=A0A7G9SGG3_9SPHN|nr:sensor histidine kinase [Sphingomonas lutea]QNN66938.1 sensor histidine kinase [Sphingomonas lutea]
MIDEVFENARVIRDLEIVGETPLKPGEERYWLTGFFPVKRSDGAVSSCGAWVVEVTDKKRVEQALVEANQAKDVLLYEVNHRIKNSLQLVVSLLTLHARGMTDDGARTALGDAQQRIEVIARIHQNLYSLGRHDHVDFTSFVGELASGIADSLIGGRKVRLTVNAEPDIILPIDRAVPMALAISELLTNAIKHGANAPRGANVGVELAKAADAIRIAVFDDGVGLPTDFNFDTASGLGMKIVRSLVHQARSSLTITDRAPGTEFVILLPLSKA